MEILIGIIIGLLLGLTGAGGSLVALPLLYGVLHLPLQQAVAISLGAVAITACFGLLSRLIKPLLVKEQQQILWFHGILFAVIASLFTSLGRYLNQLFPPSWVLAAFSVLVFIVAIRMWRQANSDPESVTIVRAQHVNVFKKTAAVCHYTLGKPGPKCIALLSLAAVITGIMSGLFGVGGGFIIVPVLVFLTGVPIQVAVATSLLVISLVSISGFTGYLLDGAIEGYQSIVLIASGGIIGMTLGTLLAHKLSGPKLQKLFVLVMIALSLLVWMRTIT